MDEPTTDTFGAPPTVAPPIEPTPTPTSITPTPEVGPAPAPSEPTPVPEVGPAPALPENPAPKNHRKLILGIIIGAIVLLATGGTIFALNFNSLFPPAKTAEPEQPAEAPEDAQAEAVAALPAVKYEFVSWNYTPYTPTTPLITIQESDTGAEVRYSIVANLTGDAKLIRADAPNFTGHTQWYTSHWFVLTGDTAKLIGNLTYNLTAAQSELTSAVTETIRVDLPELTPHTSLTANSKTYTLVGDPNSSSFDSGTLPDEATQGTTITEVKVGTTITGTLLEQRTDTATAPLTSVYWQLVTPDQRAYTYTTESGQQNDDGTLKATWLDDTHATQTFRQPSRTCGATGVTYVNNFDSLAKEKVATLTGNFSSDVYKLTDTKIYDWLEARYIYQEDTPEEATRIAGIIKNNLSNIAYMDTNNDWVFLVSSEIDAAECGKPVIYLYPETTTTVNVSVGAQVRLSDPLYPTGGWKNVIARPSGQLTYQGKNYQSLYWEGTGFGAYPDVSGIGTVVAQKDLIPTITAQLYAQGLNSTEITDFLDFWAEHLPKTPYVKLTWLSTQQMNILAPLKISPLPTTTIRVFLDTEGLTTPVSLTPQKFSAPQRKGFTVVEWGGLLR